MAFSPAKHGGKSPDRVLQPRDQFDRRPFAKIPGPAPVYFGGCPFTNVEIVGQVFICYGIFSANVCLLTLRLLPSLPNRMMQHS